MKIKIKKINLKQKKSLNYDTETIHEKTHKKKYYYKDM